MRSRSTLFLAALTALAGCTSGASVSSSVEAGTDAACASPDVATFGYKASCTFSGEDAGAPARCAEWFEGPGGDWSPFIASCQAQNGALGTEPCADAGVSGECALPPGCVAQTLLFYYGVDQVAAGQTYCAANAGVFRP